MSSTVSSTCASNVSFNNSYDVEIDNNLYNIIIEWVRSSKRFQNKDELLRAILDEYEDIYLRSYYCNECSRLLTTKRLSDQSTLFKPKISCERKYTSKHVYNELQFIYETNRYHIQSLLSNNAACSCGCPHPTDIPCGGCGCVCPPPFPQNVDEYIKQLIRNNYEQALIGFNKTSILMSLPSNINKQEFEQKMKTICDVDMTSYKLRVDLEIY